MQENEIKKWRLAIAAEAVLCLLAIAGIFCKRVEDEEYLQLTNSVFYNLVNETDDKEYIKWVDFDITYDALVSAYEWDVKTYNEPVHVDWISLLAYLGTRYGGDFPGHAKKVNKDMKAVVKKLTEENSSMDELTKEMKYYSYYKEAYGAVLGGLVGEYEELGDGSEKKYGLKAYSPIAKGFEYSHYDDFGSGRSYGYKRRHLGHDMMGQTGTPIIAIESGYIEAIGWNMYGGWRIGIRSFDKKRYYYYAHLRQNYPYAEGLEEGSVVTAGDVIGYMGHTGYSTKENTNNINVTHLHWGLELIFDESQKDSNNEIWVDVYPLTQFLAKHKSEAVKVEGTKEWKRVTDIKDPLEEEFFKNYSHTVSKGDATYDEVTSP